MTTSFSTVHGETMVSPVDGGFSVSLFCASGDEPLHYSRVWTDFGAAEKFAKSLISGRAYRSRP